MFWRQGNRPTGRDVSELEFEREALAHLDGLFAVGVRLTRSRTDAQDLVQDTFVKALRARQQFQAGTNMRAWLLRIMTNTFLNHYRRGGLERRFTEGASREVVAGGLIGASSLNDMRDPERLALRRLFEDEIARALEDLPEDFRLAVILSDVEELSYKEIAEAMGCPVGTVMSRLHRGRRLLRERLVTHAQAMGILKEPAAETAGDPVDLTSYREKRSLTS